MDWASNCEGFAETWSSLVKFTHKMNKRWVWCEQGRCACVNATWPCTVKKSHVINACHFCVRSSDKHKFWDWVGDVVLSTTIDDNGTEHDDNASLTLIDRSASQRGPNNSHVWFVSRTYHKRNVHYFLLCNSGLNFYGIYRVRHFWGWVAVLFLQSVCGQMGGGWGRKYILTNECFGTLEKVCV